MNFYNFIQEFNNCVLRKNGENLSLLLTYQHKDHSQSDRLLSQFNEDTIAKQISLPWNDLCIFHLNVCNLINQSNFIAAYKEHGNLIQYFNKALNSMSNENWMLPVLNNLIRDLRLLAIAADLETSISKHDKHIQKPHVYLEHAAELLMGLFRIVVSGNLIQINLNPFHFTHSLSVVVVRLS